MCKFKNTAAHNYYKNAQFRLPVSLKSPSIGWNAGPLCCVRNDTRCQIHNCCLTAAVYALIGMVSACIWRRPRLPARPDARPTQPARLGIDGALYDLSYHAVRGIGLAITGGTEAFAIIGSLLTIPGMAFSDGHRQSGRRLARDGSGCAALHV